MILKKLVMNNLGITLVITVSNNLSNTSGTTSFGEICEINLCLLIFQYLNPNILGIDQVLKLCKMMTC